MPRTRQRDVTQPWTGLAVSPTGALRLRTYPPDAWDPFPRALARQVEGAFKGGLAAGLLHLASKELDTPLPPPLAFGRELAKLYLSTLRAYADAPDDEPIPAPVGGLAELLSSIPPLTGAEYATPRTLADAWDEMDRLVRAELAGSGVSVHEYLQARNAAWHGVGRVTFHLAEQKDNPRTPFAFLATYAEGSSASGGARHLPLSRALAAQSSNREQLLRLLRPVHAAAERSAFIKTLADSGDLFEPLAWSAEEAYAFMLAIPDCEAAGVVVRVPDWWRDRRTARVQASAQVGARQSGGLGLDAVLSFDASLCLDGRRLGARERRAVLEGARGLRLIRGRWVEVDPERLREALAHFESVARVAGEDGVSFAEGMRLLSGLDQDLHARVADDDGRALAAAPAWGGVEAGPWLADLLADLRNPDGTACDPGDALRGTLRPYQRAGVAWLRLLGRLGLGACLADDMGLGKTVQVIALMLLLQREGDRGPHLLVVPASLLGNWQAELARFGPSLTCTVAHRSELSREDVADLADADALSGVDVVLTTYGTLTRVEALRARAWDLVVIDEAQAIKNPATVQSRAVKSLTSRMRFALTGTPVENQPGEIWSLFDFLCPGLLGSAREFTAFTRRLTTEGGAGYGPLRRLLQPYILRRLKSDPEVAPDLPAKTELKVQCRLSRVQVALYEEAVGDLAAKLERSDGIERRGIVLAALLRLKQICNHPSQWTGDGQYDPQESGKFARLAEICETIVTRQEKLLVFSQFRTLAQPLADYLAQLFGRPGLVLHGGTPVKRRAKLVEEFQTEDGPPFMFLSLKAGGTGLNLTAANHVIHFDRWWNPAVENQATDRAFRIGQQRNVLVHAFSCQGTIEEKIDAMLESKRELALEILGAGPERTLTELDSDELLKLVALDVRRASD